MRGARYGLYGCLLGVWAAVGRVSACAVCGFDQGERGLAYVIAGAIMNVVPLVLIGSLAWYLWRRVRSPQTLRTAQRAPLPTGPDPVPEAEPCVHSRT
jgi:hypothetical protein